MNIYCDYAGHKTPILMTPTEEVAVYQDGLINPEEFDGIKEVRCRNCGKIMGTVTYDEESGKIFELSYEDGERLINFKYDRVNYVFFGDKYYARFNPKDSKHIRLPISLSLNGDTTMQDFIDKLEQRLIKLENFK